MLLYYLFWMFMGFIIVFYIIFGTNLLIGGPAQIVVFLPISVFRRIGISNRVQTEWNLRESYFVERKQSRILGVDVREASRKPRGKEARPRGLCPPRGSSDPLPKYHGCLLVQEKSSWSFIPFGLCLVFLFYETQKQGKNRNWHWAPD